MRCDRKPLAVEHVLHPPEEFFADQGSKAASLAERHYLRLFKEIVRHVWKQRLTASESILRAAKAKLAELENRKNRLVDFLLEGRLDQQTYDEQTARLRSEVESAERELCEADLEQMDVEAVLVFAERLVERPHQLWLESSLGAKATVTAGVLSPMD